MVNIFIHNFGEDPVGILTSIGKYSTKGGLSLARFKKTSSAWQNLHSGPDQLSTHRSVLHNGVFPIRHGESEPFLCWMFHGFWVFLVCLAMKNGDFSHGFLMCSPRGRRPLSCLCWRPRPPRRSAVPPRRSGRSCGRRRRRSFLRFFFGDFQGDF